ncbi:heat-inducible transcriptional repressor HrcA [Chlamydiifrater phoenicopteri]|uniref:heat-inducible transcriptional repressor HrcA n=1 Tax=Chlamydiifrater phoenicopteri TaxID=2681469 RepID=UPI001BCEED6C|nr:heat-inducible transcriptional repressor HrcA [Chlamydiifrater phoenicopteri]
MDAGTPSKKDEKFFSVLFATVELFLATGLPVGSKTLQEKSFPHLSTATIRNYFMDLEKRELLRKNHVSGGRIPTDAALRAYVNLYTHDDSYPISPGILSFLEDFPDESRNIVRDLQNVTEKIGEALQLPTFFSAPRFENDVITNIQLTTIDDSRFLVILTSEFGQIFTDVLWFSSPEGKSSLEKIELSLKSRLRKESCPTELSATEKTLAYRIYNEVVIRYLTRYCNFSEEDLYFTGFSKLLRYETFSDPELLASGLALFENRKDMHVIVNACMSRNEPTILIGEELTELLKNSYSGCSVVAFPYRINRTPLGALGVLGPSNIPYREILGALKLFSNKLQEGLTKSFYKFKLSFRKPKESRTTLEKNNHVLTQRTSIKLLPSKEIS